MKMNTSIQTPTGESKISNTIISELDANQTKGIIARDYRLGLTVTDRRNDEFSILVVLHTADGSPIDSATVLISLTEGAKFYFKNGKDVVSGTIVIEKLIDVISD